MICRRFGLTGRAATQNQWVLPGSGAIGVIRTPTFLQIQPDMGGSASLPATGPDHANPT
nr:MAG TPA: hypothetical protein [Caudoviricetes sp.]